MNEQNLKSFDSNQSREEAKKNGAKGGIASGKARRAYKNQRATLEWLLSRPYQKKGEDVISPITGKPITIGEGLTTAQLKKALTGDTKSYVALLDVLGERIQNINQEITIKKDKYDEMSEEELRAEAERLTKSMEQQ
ncbi:MAG: hypothetical protein IKR17_06005 [Bacteroidales bacterium]|nr:hypothetical protein [Bacteroidales bacterium]